MIVGVWVFQLWSTNRLYEYNLSYVKNNDLRWEYLKQTGFKHSVSDEQLASALVKSDMDTIRWLFLLVYVVIIVLWLYGLRTEITVSNKRIYGRNGMGKQVDLPLDSISSVRTSSNKGIKVSSYSGNIKFPFLRSQKEVYEAICGLLVDRQSMPVAPVVPQKESASSVSNADEIKKYKELLDLGIITQEEFDVKKKQYLDL